ncbi:MAG: hypothetical protein Q9187_005020, partial [Circinaria calcarea]
MEEVTEISRISAVATVGIQLSVKLIAFAEEYGRKPHRLSHLSRDIAITSGVLQQLGVFVTSTPDEKTALISQTGRQATVESATACNAIFDEIHTAFKALAALLDGQAPIPSHYLNTPFSWPRINILWDDLGELRLALMLQLQTITLASCRKASQCNTPTAAQKEEERELIQSIVALQTQQNFPEKHVMDVSRRNLETQNIFRSAGEQDAGHRIGVTDGARARKDRIAAETPKGTAIDSSNRENKYSSPKRAVDWPEITEICKDVQVEIKDIERQNSGSSGLAQRTYSQSSTKREPTHSSNTQAPDSRTQPESPDMVVLFLG